MGEQLANYFYVIWIRENNIYIIGNMENSIYVIWNIENYIYVIWNTEHLSERSVLPRVGFAILWWDGILNRKQEVGKLANAEPSGKVFNWILYMLKSCGLTKVKSIKTSAQTTHGVSKLLREVIKKKTVRLTA